MYQQNNMQVPQMPGMQPNVVVINTQQPNQYNQNKGPGEWQNSLCDCMSDCNSCCLTLWCPCVQYGYNYEKVHGSGCCSQGCVWLLAAYFGFACCVHMGLRGDIRRRYNIEEGCNDCLTTWCCSGCAICQEARELKQRG